MTKNLSDGFPPCEDPSICGIFGPEDLCPACRKAWNKKQAEEAKTRPKRRTEAIGLEKVRDYMRQHGFPPEVPPRTNKENPHAKT